MSQSASTHSLSSEDDNAILDKNLSSPKLTIERTVNILLREQTNKGKINFENYANKNGALKFKIKIENESQAYLCSPQKIYKSFSQLNRLKSHQLLNYQNLSRDSNYFAAKQLEFKKPTLQVPSPFFTQQQLQLYQKTYFGNYIPDRNSYPNTIFVSKIFVHQTKCPYENIYPKQNVIVINHHFCYYIFVQPNQGNSLTRTFPQRILYSLQQPPI